ncbi:beta-N-acetylhexosaminidase [Photobacterium damselae subsp. damselae]|uniref:beta-N-acetylhexosaminidase n=1 Tax=Photobacterium damselae TaxID=38293 RepID=UPI000D07957E|nr:beta-N-acetylhexosaminidase [Photobacterium damselae]PSB89809.1 beta-hexosaminidase [Photobacterium damselae subsp. damselae]UKA25028.1 beta-N-acetylhexosaminidase [Photobacterium damselae subsp. damselae]UKA28845.1 beta-N-acetylhexosaminidase [Photobacterium damselae subsp. damselae]
MSYRLDFTVLEIQESQSRFALTLHNLTDEALQGWSLHFFISRMIKPETLANASIEQLGSYVILTPNTETPIPANGHFYCEFVMGTAPFTLHDDGIPEAFISCISDGDTIVPRPVEVTTIDLGQAAVERYTTPLPEQAGTISIVPKPHHLIELGGVFIIDQFTSISTKLPAPAEGAIRWLQHEYQRHTQQELITLANGNIHYQLHDELAPSQYRLLVESDHIWLQASDKAGFVHATASLLQLLPTEPSHNADAAYTIPMVEIEDHPIYHYRGMMLDCGRHFHPLSRIKTLLDHLARYKFNTFHWHLTDDEGWRIEIDAFPELTRIGAWRGPNECIAPQFTTIDKRYGGFYSKEEVREIIAYAADRAIMVIPEIDIPGHCRAAIRSLPHLLIDPQDRSQYRSIQGYPDNVLSPAIEGTYTFIKTVLEEICELFPAPFVHIGADEVPNGVWTQSPGCQELMAKHGYQDPKELQGHLLRFAQEVLSHQDKQMMGWEEATHGEKVSKETVIFSWLSEEAGLTCIKQGYPVVMQPAQYTYLDLAQGFSADEAGVDWAGKVTLDKVYSYQPVAEIAEDDPTRKQILGIQTALWCELINNQSRFDYMIYPRLLAVAEVAWTAQKNRHWEDFKARLKGQLNYLDKAGINYRRCE